MPFTIGSVLDIRHEVRQVRRGGIDFCTMSLHGEPMLEKACSLLIESWNSTSCMIKFTCIQELQLLMSPQLMDIFSSVKKLFFFSFQMLFTP